MGLVVPKYGGTGLPQVMPTVSPSVPMGPPASPWAFGNMAPGPALDLSGVEREARDLYERSLRRANQVAALDAENKTAALEQQLYYDPQHGALHTQGIDAIPAVGQADAKYAQGIADIAAGLHNEDQKLQYRELVVNRRQKLYVDTSNHVAQQVQAHDLSVRDTGIRKRLDAATKPGQSPTAILDLITQQQAIYTDWAAAHGIGPEEHAAGLADIASTTHRGVIAAMLDRGQVADAQAYYTQHHDALTGTDDAALAKPLEVGSLLGASQRERDRILAAATTPSDAYRQAQAIVDPNLQAQTAQRLDEYYARQHAAQARDQEDAFQQATTILEQHLSYAAIPPTLIARMSPEQHENLHTYLKTLLKQDDRVTDPNMMFAFLNMAAVNEVTGQTFTKIPLLQYRKYFSDEDYQRLQSLQLQLTEGHYGRVSLVQEQRKEEQRQAKLAKAQADYSARIGIYEKLGTAVPPLTQQLIFDQTLGKAYTELGLNPDGTPRTPTPGSPIGPGWTPTLAAPSPTIRGPQVAPMTGSVQQLFGGQR